MQQSHLRGVLSARRRKRKELPSSQLRGHLLRRRAGMGTYLHGRLRLSVAYLTLDQVAGAKRQACDDPGGCGGAGHPVVMVDYGHGLSWRAVLVVADRVGNFPLTGPGRTHIAEGIVVVGAGLTPSRYFPLAASSAAAHLVPTVVENLSRCPSPYALQLTDERPWTASCAETSLSLSGLVASGRWREVLS